MDNGEKKYQGCMDKIAWNKKLRMCMGCCLTIESEQTLVCSWESCKVTWNKFLKDKNEFESSLKTTLQL